MAGRAPQCMVSCPAAGRSEPKELAPGSEFTAVCIHQSVCRDSREDFGDPCLDGLEVSCLIPLGSVKWASPVAQLVKNLPAMRETWVWSLGWEDSSGEGRGYPLQYSGLENSKDCIVHGVAKSWTG